LFASFILGEVFTVFHLIGTLLVITSIIMIVRQKEIPKNK
jgi:drug/metabolite transporter (DMT)-like permease